ncbi:protein kinase domain-containing protein, partial [Kitasatospora nipponensis]|uniref:protein kinase domain-containing protein n=1 Tax=Kitasatospora nipponensis TaxID=258049 RepID=UPI0031D74811
MWARGTVLGGRYTLAERLGGGAMGDVWRADDGVLERRVAVKILLPALLDDATFMERFRREARILASLDHPGVVDVHDYGENAGDEASGDGEGTRIAYIVMELVAGRPLDEVLAATGPMPVGPTLDIVAQALDALQAAHRRDIVHRDIKPANLMLRDDGRVTMTDFGIARALAGTKITTSHSVLGTALYLAPERAEGAPTTAASDLYSTGVVCYEMLTGEPPFAGETALEVVLKHVREPAPALSADFPQPVRDFVARALAKRPEDRFASAEEMAAAARRAADGLPWASAAAGAPAIAPATSGTVPLGPAEPAAPAPAPAAGAKAEVAPAPVPVPTPAVDAAVLAAAVAATVAAQRPRRGWRRSLVPVVIPCCVTVVAGTALLVQTVPFRSDASTPDPRPSVTLTATGGTASAPGPAAPGATAPSQASTAATTPADPAAASAPGSAPASGPANPAPGAAASG